MVTLANPTTGPRIVPYLATRLPSDVLPNGHPAFRVTQPFRTGHEAIDIGNFYCGDPILAPIAGTIHNRVDTRGAIICEVHSPYGIFGVGHLQKVAKPGGTVVKPGDVIGYVGSTGLSVGGCHAHMSWTVGFRNYDPWPLFVWNTEVRAKINGNGINIRESPGAEVAAPIFATTINGRIIRASNGKDLGSLSYFRKARHSVYGAYHGIQPYPDRWTPIWLSGAWRAVARPLATYK